MFAGLLVDSADGPAAGRGLRNEFGRRVPVHGQDAATRGGLFYAGRCATV